MRTTFLILCLMPVAGGAPLQAQPLSSVATSHVLELDGTNSYVQLPDDIFHEFTEGTVEAWIYPNHWDDLQRFFSFGGYEHDMGAGRLGNVNSGLNFFISAIQIGLPRSQVRAEMPLLARDWLHVAVVSGPGGMELYLNGGLLGTAPFTGSFNSIAGGPNLIGAWHRKDDAGLG